jgi:hypothetical protein
MIMKLKAEARAQGGCRASGKNICTSMTSGEKTKDSELASIPQI